MRLITYITDGSQRVGAVADNAVVDLSDQFPSMLALIEGGEAALAIARSLVEKRAPVAALEKVRLLAPIPTPHRNVLCVGWNYLKHFAEGVGMRGDQEQKLPDHPTFFTKPTLTVIGPEESVELDRTFTAQLDYEAELAVVIGRTGLNIPASEARSHIFGYTLANDITARDVQRRHGGQWFKGKAMDASCPMGPCIVTADEIPDPQALLIQGLVNGELRQDANTRQMIFTIDRLIEELSKGMTLLPGDILLTGTPEGAGFGRTPPQYLRPGDDLVVRVPEIGLLRTSIVDRTDRARQEQQ